MDKIFTNDLNSVSIPKEKRAIFAQAKSFFKPLIKSIPIHYVSFTDSDYDVIVGCNLVPSVEIGMNCEFCFKHDENDYDTYLVFVRKVS